MMEVSPVTVGQLKFKLNETVSSQTRSECALYCRNLQKVTIGYIYDKTTGKKTKNASLLEMLDNAVVTFYINDADIMNFLIMSAFSECTPSRAVTFAKKRQRWRRTTLLT